MSQDSEDFPPPTIVVVDTSVLIKFKSIVGINEQWGLLLKMTEHVKSGALCFPRQVVAEMSDGQHPDAPGVWVVGHKKDCRHPQPAEETLATVLGVAPLLVDVESTKEYADPYVAAQAYELQDRHQSSRVVVATNDTVDRLPVKTSLLSACNDLDVQVIGPEEFIEWLGSGALPD
ncbi:DUF4411 family protein [Aeromicrobium sp.]|uniref:DUF4411 family protein n=1 Tax=Aeromicrobium sp. TaxID=1871063 RepID=UPI0040332898